MVGYQFSCKVIHFLLKSEKSAKKERKSNKKRLKSICNTMDLRHFVKSVKNH